jgi:hypothetical protein
MSCGEAEGSNPARNARNARNARKAINACMRTVSLAVLTNG